MTHASQTPSHPCQLQVMADGGEVTMPFAATFWSRGFGACNDRFGVPWMVDTAGER